jgi:hypothetical protein
MYLRLTNEGSDLMSYKLKNIITISMILGIVVPFILITDLFPFVRFGMFAEPIKSSRQTEQFIVYGINTDGKKEIFNPMDIGINPNTFHYLMRNHYYRNEMELFNQKILSIPKTKLTKLQIYKIVPLDNQVYCDTISIY